MKKVLILAAVMLLVATAAFAGISNTKHNLSTAGMTTELCAYCHTPHFANGNMKPLWNRALPAGPFTFYGTTVKGTAPASVLGAASAACMSCHDGVTSINALTNVPGPGLGTPGAVVVLGVAPLNTNNASVIGNDLSNDHPVSIPYTIANGLNTPGLPATDGIVRVNTGGVNGADGNAIECVSCHDPHLETPALFLRISNTGSALCIACHNK